MHITSRVFVFMCILSSISCLLTSTKNTFYRISNNRLKPQLRLSNHETLPEPGFNSISKSAYPIYALRNTTIPNNNNTTTSKTWPITIPGTKTIGVDYGCVRTGVAVTIGYNPRPLAIFSDLSDLELSKEIVKIAVAEKARQIVVGMPYEMNGTETEQAGLVRDFSNVLVRQVYCSLGPNCPIWFWDERCSSKEEID